MLRSISCSIAPLPCEFVRKRLAGRSGAAERNATARSQPGRERQDRRIPPGNARISLPAVQLPVWRARRVSTAPAVFHEGPFGLNAEALLLQSPRSGFASQGLISVRLLDVDAPAA